jgi:hypothetical protein
MSLDRELLAAFGASLGDAAFVGAFGLTQAIRAASEFELAAAKARHVFNDPPLRDGALGGLLGYRIVLNQALPDGQVLMFHGDRLIVIGTRPRSEVELAGHYARYLVRRGLADVLEWLGEKVGPERPPTHWEILDAMRVMGR